MRKIVDVPIDFVRANEERVRAAEERQRLIERKNAIAGRLRAIKAAGCVDPIERRKLRTECAAIELALRGEKAVFRSEWCEMFTTIAEEYLDRDQYLTLVDMTDEAMKPDA